MNMDLDIDLEMIANSFDNHVEDDTCTELKDAQQSSKKHNNSIGFASTIGEEQVSTSSDNRYVIMFGKKVTSIHY